MTPEEYLRAKGWVLASNYDVGQWWSPLDMWAVEGPLSCHAPPISPSTTVDAVAIQVRRDHDCAEFARAYGGALAAAEFDETMTNND